MATSYAVEATSVQKSRGAHVAGGPADTYLKNAMTELPGLRIEIGKGADLLARNKRAFAENRFRGLGF